MVVAMAMSSLISRGTSDRDGASRDRTRRASLAALSVGWGQRRPPAWVVGGGRMGVRPNGASSAGRACSMGNQEAREDAGAERPSGGRPRRRSLMMITSADPTPRVQEQLAVVPVAATSAPAFVEGEAGLAQRRLCFRGVVAPRPTVVARPKRRQPPPPFLQFRHGYRLHNPGKE